MGEIKDYFIKRVFAKIHKRISPINYWNKELYKLSRNDPEVYLLLDMIKELEDKKMLKQAEKLDILLSDFPYPQRPDEQIANYGYSKYYTLGTTGELLLHWETRELLRKAIRERKPAYKREMRETVNIWISAIVGIIGALTGLFSVILR